MGRGSYAHQPAEPPQRALLQPMTNTKKALSERPSHRSLRPEDSIADKAPRCEEWFGRMSFAPDFAQECRWFPDLAILVAGFSCEIPDS